MAGKKKEQREKPLEKMTVTDLREMAKGMPEISGVYGMNKSELIRAIKDVKGIKDKVVKKSNTSTRDLKKKIKALKVDRYAVLESDNVKMALIYRRRISRLKKKTRKAA